jgi:hypothetical protein
MKTALLPVFIRLVFLVILCTLQVVLNMIKHDLSFFQPLIQIRHRASIIHGDAKVPRFVAT